MLSYREFYIWLDGYLSAKSKEENDGNVYFMDIFPILEKMKEVNGDDVTCGMKKGWDYNDENKY